MVWKSRTRRALSISKWRRIRWRSESGRLTIWKSQCTSSTCGLPRSLQKVTAPSAALNMIGLSLPNRVARLISAIGRPLLWRGQSGRTRPRTLRCQSQIVGVRGRVPGSQPRCPAQLPLATEEDARHLVASQHELDVPIKLEPDIVANPIPEPCETRLARQEIAEAVELHGPHHDAKPALDVANPLADDRVLAEQAAKARGAAELGLLVARQIEPAHRQLLDARGQPEEALHDRRQPLGVLRTSRQVRDEEPLGVIGHHVAIARAGHSMPRERADVDGEAILGRSVLMHGRARFRPRAVGEEAGPTAKEVEEPRQRGIAVVQQALARVLRHVQRQRPVGAEQAEEPLLQARPGPLLLERRQGRGRERDRRLLRDADRLVRRAQRLAQTRPVGEQAFDAAQGLEEIEIPGRPRQRREEPYTSCRAAIRGGHRLISPRRSDTSTSSVNVFIDARRAKTCSSTVPSRNALAPANGASSTVILISRPRPKTIGPGAGSRRVRGVTATRRTPWVCRRDTASGMSASTRSA